METTYHGVKLNIDGSFYYNTKKGGAGGVFRNTEGNWLLGFRAFINVANTFNAEVMALILGLDIDKKMSFTALCRSH